MFENSGILGKGIEIAFTNDVWRQEDEDVRGREWVNLGNVNLLNLEIIADETRLLFQFWAAISSVCWENWSPNGRVVKHPEEPD